MIGDHRVQRRARGVGHDRHPAPSITLRFPKFYGDSYQGLLALRSSATKPGFFTADERLVNLHHPGELFAAGADQHGPQPVQHRPRRLVRTDLQGALQALS
jgi:hypothetical protein